MFDYLDNIQAPGAWLYEHSMEKVKNGIIDFIIDYIEVLPIVVVLSIPVYFFLRMISKTLAKLGVAAVFVYSGFVFVTMA